MFEDKKPDSVNLTVSEKLLLSFMRQQKSTKRWQILFRLLFFLWLFIFTGITFNLFDHTNFPFVKSNKSLHTAVIYVKGVIGGEENSSAESIIASLKEASEDAKAKAIILSVDSPGGSAVQSGEIYDEIIRLRKKNPEKHIYTVIGDLGASGAYYIASASNKIYANRASFIGSIGVYIAGYDATALAHKLGISRRIYKAGNNKIFMDPLLPDTSESIKNIESNIAEVHQQFIDCVKSGRGNRLKADYPGLFSGLIWTGEKALKIGLIDAIGDIHYVAEEVVGEKELVDYSYKPDMLQNVFHQLSMAVQDAVKPLIKTWLSSSGHVMS